MTQKWEVRFRYEEPQIFDDANEAASAITSNESYIDDYEVDIDEAIDDNYGSIEINGQTFWASTILKEMAEDSYWDYARSEREYYADESTGDVENTLERMDDGDEESFEGGIRVVCRYEEEYDEELPVDGFMEVLDYAT